MERTELDMLSQLLEEDDFAKGIAMGLSSERAAALGRLRAMQPWQMSVIPTAISAMVSCLLISIKILPVSSASANAGSSMTAASGGRMWAT